MDVEPSQEGLYDAPASEMDDEKKQIERQMRIDRLKQRREEMSQNATNVSSALTKSSEPTPLMIKDPLPPIGLRMDLINEAVEFLTNPRVVTAPMATKKKFLSQRKGLTDAEIEEAVKKSQQSNAQISSNQTQIQSYQPSPTQSQPQQQGYYPPVVYSQPPPPPPPMAPAVINQSPSLRAIALVVILCFGLGNMIYYFVKKYVISYWWPRKNVVVDTIEQFEQKMKVQQEALNNQASEVKDALGVIRSFLENQVTDWTERHRLEELRQEQDNAKVSELKKEISSVRHLMPSVVGNVLNRSLKPSALGNDVLEEIKNELASLKNAIKNFTQSNTQQRSNSIGSLSASSSTLNTASSSSATNVEGQAESSEKTSKTISSNIISDNSNNETVSTPGSTKRPLPAWMKQGQPALPSWQLVENKEKDASNNNNNNNNADNQAAISNNNSVIPEQQTQVELSEPSQSQSETQNRTENVSNEPSLQTPPNPASNDPPYSQGYLEILRMMQQGITPPGLKTDVDDSVKDPNAPLEQGVLPKPSKPWLNSIATAAPLPFKVQESDLNITDEYVPKEIN